MIFQTRVAVIKGGEKLSLRQKLICFREQFRAIPRNSAQWNSDWQPSKKLAHLTVRQWDILSNGSTTDLFLPSVRNFIAKLTLLTFFSRFWRSKFTLKTFYIRTKLNYFFFIFLSIRLRYEGYWWDKIKFPMKLSQRSSKFSYFWANPVIMFL